MHSQKSKADTFPKLSTFSLILVLSATLFFVVGCASNSGVSPMGQNSFIVTRQAATGFSGAGTLKADAISEAEAYCRARGKVLKILSVTEAEPPYVFGNFPKAEVIFKALDPGDPELEIPSEYDSSGTQIRVGSKQVDRSEVSVSIKDEADEDLYNKLQKLGELRKEGILTEEEFQQEKQHLLSEQR